MHVQLRNYTTLKYNYENRLTSQWKEKRERDLRTCTVMDTPYLLTNDDNLNYFRTATLPARRPSLARSSVFELHIYKSNLVSFLYSVTQP